MAAYATLDDYRLITGATVAVEDEPRITRALQAASDLFSLYLGDREPEVVTTYPSLLADLTVARVHRLRTVPVGVRSESVGGASVTYADGASDRFGLTGDETRLLSMMLTGGRSVSLRAVVMGERGALAPSAYLTDGEPM